MRGRSPKARHVDGLVVGGLTGGAVVLRGRCQGARHVEGLEVEGLKGWGEMADF